MNVTTLLKLPTLQVAQQLLGWKLEHQSMIAKIVETEAYLQSDPASHSYRGQTQRNQAMFMSAGTWYVYKSYGVHHCLNLVTSSPQTGEAVLIRAIEPVSGIKKMQHNRQQSQLTNIGSGPGKLTQAMNIDLTINKTTVWDELKLIAPSMPLLADQIIARPRVGISQAQDKKWRFYIKNNPHVSRK